MAKAKVIRRIERQEEEKRQWQQIRKERREKLKLYTAELDENGTKTF